MITVWRWWWKEVSTFLFLYGLLWNGQYECDFWQGCANGFLKTFDVLTTGVGKALGGNPQPNQNVAYKMCSCGHQRNDHY